ncbi:MAG: hypothetical protein GF417_01075, partial [Candidatus Latescibacteria bacterium]|nr:hypothetical protein [bacterium]MBD3423019.1 hypothetical protein [Candidatus Latescibacterota bacterium]
MTALFISLLVLSGCQGDGSGERKPVPVGENLLKNPGFESWTDSIPEHWKIRKVENLSRHGGETNRIIRSSEEKKSGKYSCRFSAGDSATNWTVLMQNIPVVPGAEMVLSSNVRSIDLQPVDRRNRFSNMYIIFMNEKGERVNRKPGKFVDHMTRPCRGNFMWGDRRKKIDVPEEAHYAEVGLLCTMSGDMFFDNVSAAIKKGPPWEITETSYIEFYTLPGHPLPKEALEKEARLIESYADRIDLPEPERKIKYFYYPNEDEFKRINLERKYYQAVRWKKKEIHTMAEYEDMVVTHLLVSDMGRPPVGLAKGLVFY